MIFFKHEQNTFLLFFTLVMTIFYSILFFASCNSVDNTDNTVYIVNDNDNASMWHNPLKSYDLFSNIFVEEITFTIIPNKKKMNILNF